MPSPRGRRWPGWPARRLADVGVDAGSANTLLYAGGRGIVLQEPSVIAVERSTGATVAVGAEARRMLGRTPERIEVLRPLRGGAIADVGTARCMWQHFLRLAGCDRRLGRPRIAVAISVGATDIERRAAREAALQVGARDAYLVDELLAAAVGAGLPVAEPRGSMVVDVGGGTSCAAVTALGGVVVHRCTRVAGDTMDRAIAGHLRRRHRLLVGDATAERVKIAVGSAGCAPPGAVPVQGRDAVSGRPRQIELSGCEVGEVLAAAVESILHVVEETLALAPPDLAADVGRHGIVLTGGGAQLRGLDAAIAARTGVPTRVADEPLACVARGLGQIIDGGTGGRPPLGPGSVLLSRT